jgi:hypothetical protein
LFLNFRAIHADIACLIDKTAAIDSLLALKFKETDILSKDKVTEFLNEWRQLNQQRFLQLKQQHQTVKEIDAKFDHLLEITDKKMLQRKMNISIDEDKFVATLEALRQYHPEQKSLFDTVLTNQRFNITKLIGILKVSLPEFARCCEQFSTPNSLAIDYELTEMVKLAGSAEKVKWELQILGNKLELVQTVVTIDDSDDELLAKMCASRSEMDQTNLKTRLMATPPVNFNFAVSAGVGGRPTRLALFDEEVQQLNRTKMFQLKPSKLGQCSLRSIEPLSPTNNSLNASSLRKKVNPLGLLNKLNQSARKAKLGK